jgi:predicted  nucleic acid-binding Zn-ribbon protein
MATNAPTEDYFIQYGYGISEIQSPKVDLKKDSQVSISSTDSKISISDNKGSTKTIPTLKVTNDLESKITRLEEVSRIMKDQINHLNSQISKLSQSVSSLAKKNFNNYEY